MGDPFAAAKSVADAVLYEGYVLYPYRASAQKNQLRWQFGVLAPPLQAEADGTERWSVRTECLVDPTACAELAVRVRFLQVQRREMEAIGEDGAFHPVEVLLVDGVPWTGWDEAVEREVDLGPIPVVPPGGAGASQSFTIPGGEDAEVLGTSGRAVRRRADLAGVVCVTTAWVQEGSRALVRVTVDVENTTAWFGAGAPRDDVMLHSLIAVHTLLAVNGGRFVSLLDPPDDAREAAAATSSDGAYPVLIGDPANSTVVLSSPIILYDQPQIASQSAGDFCDATEIDEILALRVLTLTDEEKIEARATDPRAAAIIDRCDGMPPEVWARLHGEMRTVDSLAATPEVAAGVPWWDPGADAAVDPSTDTVSIEGVDVGKGTKVTLRPNRRADAHDIFLDGMDATVAGIFHDVDGEPHVAVTLDDDPAAELFEWQGRFYYFAPDEVALR
jgi:hypothetical protein